MLYDEAVEATSELLCLHWLLLYATSVEHTGCHCLIDAAASKIADCFGICLIVVSFFFFFFCQNFRLKG